MDWSQLADGHALILWPIAIMVAVCAELLRRLLAQFDALAAELKAHREHCAATHATVDINLDRLRTKAGVELKE